MAPFFYVNLFRIIAKFEISLQVLNCFPVICSGQGAVLEDGLWRIGRVAPVTVAEVGVGVHGAVDRAGSPTAAEVRRIGVVVLLKVAVQG